MPSVLFGKISPQLHNSNISDTPVHCVDITGLPNAIASQIAKQ